MTIPRKDHRKATRLTVVTFTTGKEKVRYDSFEMKSEVLHGTGAKPSE